MHAAARNYITILQDLINAAGKHTLEYLNMQDNYGLTALKHAKIGSPETFVFLEKKLKELTLIECSLCFETKRLGDCHTMSNCNESCLTKSTKDRQGCKATFCTECLLQHIAVRLDEGSTLGLTCPNVQCGKKMHQSDIQVITQNNKELYDRFDKIALKEYMADNPNMKYCQTPNCDFGFILEEGVDRFIIQCSCTHNYCSHCLFNHSLKITCDQAKTDRELAQNPELAQQATEKWIAENTKPCPQCKTSIQKNKGCNHMTCKKCQHEFCYVCGKQWGDRVTCPYYNHPAVPNNNNG